MLEGIGIGFFMEQDVVADIETGRLVRVLEDWTPRFAGLCLYYPGRRNPSAAMKAFIGLARAWGGKATPDRPRRGRTRAARKSIPID
ncbi:DNA-binding transcriptional LysR family regulator [Rhodopseudomonas rhenobacensis]|uniref:DNA-binding transcriptional LysR family regulator n=1 Tax=Rhodopseudomonas rhenobacensis TaxID=87461 RepID=A0A7W8DZ74_9BRAD|nr:DNA-binding transcriptional LysR family regulator [Rhodopseudomonas rhenobacensis]